ncbi:exodeoxyribonuclease VII small subunit [Ligilactobacillus sp. WILCCON 0076]|uniref:Exodeoxyribonuclease 7 small subunit n=1 Tax=Ligilactobacillus ubinensis TaxID=2876789 RepID=A0A9X2JKV1_9LACO|nr:exodeoxyribonuclease VII small subunit [Ligilactobacillus ubinensis]MCP0886423.1 exodeoxyribonuclease VII small subunit [Ligilactobacillus ubinensis]
MTKQTMSFEENLTRLDQIVTQLEKGDTPLEDAMTQFQEGMVLSKKLEETLKDAEKTLTKIIDDNGEEQLFEEKSDENK